MLISGVLDLHNQIAYLLRSTFNNATTFPVAWNVNNPLRFYPEGSTMAADFTRGLYMQNGVLLPASDMLTCTRASTGTVSWKDGTITSVDANTPRISDKGLLVEEQRTNTVIYSNDFTLWNIGGATVTNVSGLSPFGATTLAKIAKTSPFHSINRILSGYSIGNTICGSVYIKAGTGSIATLLLTGDNGGAAGLGRVQFNLADGTASQTSGSTNVVDFGMEYLPSYGMYRCWMSYTLPANSSVRFYFYPGTYNATETKDVLVCDAQVELGAFPTSPIPTTSAATTRSADVITVNNFANWYNQSEGTLISKIFKTNSDSTTNKFIVSINDNASGGTLDDIGSYLSTTTSHVGLIVDEGATLAAVSSAALSLNTYHAIAFTFKADDGRVYIDGASGGTPDTAFTMPTPDRMFIGTRYSGLSPFNDYIQSIEYIPSSSTDAQLQQLSAL